MREVEPAALHISDPKVGHLNELRIGLPLGVLSDPPDRKYSVRAWEGTLEARPWWVLVAGCALWFGVRGYGGVPGFVILGGSWSGSPVVSVVQGRSCWRAWPSGGLPPAVAQAWR